MIDKETILKLAMERYENELNLTNEDYELYEQDKLFTLNYEGCQWDTNVRAEREHDPVSPKPCIVVNKVLDKVNKIVSEFKERKASYKINPVDSGEDVTLARIYSGIIKHIEYSSNAQNIYNASHENCLMSGVGAWRVDIVDDKDNPFLRALKINPIADPFSVRFDPFSKKYDKSDARYVFVLDEIPLEDFKAKYPDASQDGFESQNSWVNKDSVKIAEYWWKEKEKIKMYSIMREGLQVVVDTKPEPTDHIIEEKEVEKEIVYQALIGAGELLKPIVKFPIGNFPIVFQGGQTTFIDGLMRYSGMVRQAKEPQRSYNYWVSTISEQVSLQPKTPYIVTAGNIKNYKHIWDQAHKKNFPYLPIDVDESGYIPTRQAPPAVSSALTVELERAERDIMSAMGVYEATLGDQGREVSGTAIVAKLRQGSLTGYIYADNFKHSLIYSTKLLIDLIPIIYDTERQFMITGDSGKEETVLVNSDVPSLIKNNLNPDLHTVSKDTDDKINQLSKGKFDLRVSIGENHVTQRNENVEMLVKLVTLLPNYANQIAPVLIKNIDTPAAQEISEILSQPQPEPKEDPLVMLAAKELELKGFIEAQKLEQADRKLKFDMAMDQQKQDLDEVKASIEILTEGLNVGRVMTTSGRLDQS